MDSMEEIRIIPPGPRACPLCATIHQPGQPHERDSLYYQYRFFKWQGRFPTWKDAISHCKNKAAVIKDLEKRGVYLDSEEAGNG